MQIFNVLFDSSVALSLLKDLLGKRRSVSWGHVKNHHEICMNLSPENTHLGLIGIAAELRETGNLTIAR